MPDISTIWNTTRGDWQVAGADLLSQNDVVTALLISLFTDAAALPDDVIPDGSNDPRGWWGDPDIGSRLWLLERAKRTAATLARAQDYITEASQWMLDDGVASRIDVSVEWTAKTTLAAQIVVYHPITDQPFVRVTTQNAFQLPAAQIWGWNDNTTAGEWVPLVAPPPPPPTPTANFSGTPLTGGSPLSVAFTDLSSPTPDSWSWDFGDGDTSTVQNPTHNYASAGSYTVELTVTLGIISVPVTKTAYVTVSISPVSPAGIAGNTSWADFTDATSMSTDASTFPGGGAAPTTTGDQIMWVNSKDTGATRNIQDPGHAGRAFFLGGLAIAEYVTGVLNGHSVGRFATANIAQCKERNLSSLFDTENTSTQYIFANDGSEGTYIVAMVVNGAKGDTSPNATHNEHITDSAASNEQYMLACYQSGSNIQLQVVNSSGGGGGFVGTLEETVVVGTPIIASVRFQVPGNLQLRVNGGSWQTVAITSTKGIVEDWFIGAGSATLLMDVAHAATFNVALSDDSLGSVEAYMAAELGITL